MLQYMKCDHLTMLWRLLSRQNKVAINKLLPFCAMVPLFRQSGLIVR
jgi:hypothetical protein